jgi:PBSX family phage terminase large subunit
MSRFINKNLKFLTSSLKAQRYDQEVLVDGFRGVVLEGSSRSGKTISSVDMIILICSRYEVSCTINVVKETYNEFKTTLYDDFKKRLDDFGLDNPFHRSKEIQSFKILGNKINFLGADKLTKFHGVSCDYLYINEALPIKKEIFDQLEMRCRKFWWMDYNPSLTSHWIFDAVIPRYDVGYCHTTFRDNPFISVQEKNKILSYEPWKPGSYEVVNNEVLYQGNILGGTNKPPPHPYNNESTADEFMWKVYGLGLRGAMEGLIFKHITPIDEFPDLAHTFGLDFGFMADPTAFVKHAEDKENIYLELLLYQPTETPEEIDEYFQAIGLDRKSIITADSSDRFVSESKGVIEMVASLRRMRWNVHKVRKTKNVMFWLNSMKQKKIHIVKNHLYHFAKKEQENYRLKEVNGIRINQPVDEYNHFWDSGRYSHMAHNGTKFEISMI